MNSLNTKPQIVSLISDLLNRQEDIVFAYLFGTFATKETYQNVDVAIFTRNDSDNLRLGELQTDLHLATTKKIDLVHLNNLITQSPALAHKIVSKGIIIVDK